MTTDLSCDASAGPAVTVGTGATLDMAGHSITCTAGTNPGVRIAGNGAGLRSGTVQGCHTGVDVAGSSNRVRDVVVLFSPATAYGIRAVGNVNVVKRCAVRGAVSNAYAVAGDGNRLVRNVGVGGGEATFKVESGSDNLLVSNLAYFANFNGFLLGQTSSRAALRDNTAVVGEVGFNIAGSDHRLSSNLSLDQMTRGFGMSFDSTGSRLRNNASVFSIAGFDIVGSSSLLQRNMALGHSATGMIVSGPQNTVGQNVALGNALLDLSDVSGCQNTWTMNVFATSDAVCIQ